MARLEVIADAASVVGGLVVRSEHPAALAAVPDALVQVLGLEQDVGSCWALHPSEQDGLRTAAYGEDRAELGMGAHVDVLELTRPRQRNVVWIDRYHLVGSFQPVAVASRLLGLYAGGPGSLLLYVHHPTVTATFQHVVGQAPYDGGATWDAATIVEQSRFAVRYDGRFPQQLRLTCNSTLRSHVAQALHALAGTVAPW